jgi:hypothetical protein
MSTPTPPTALIVIVAGQRFSVQSDTDAEAIRQQLLGMGFADVANAKATKGKDPDGTPTLEFVKQAGTKGLTGGDLAARLARVPAAPLPEEAAAAARLVVRLFGEQLTFEEAVADDVALEALRATAAQSSSSRITGAPLCQKLDALPAVASRDARAW